MSSRLGRRRNSLRPATGMSRQNDLRIVVATSPQMSTDGPQVSTDVGLVKSAMLYADHVELLSPTAAALQAMQLAAGNAEELCLSMMETFSEAQLRWLGSTGDIDALRQTAQIGEA